MNQRSRVRFPPTADSFFILHSKVIMSIIILPFLIYFFFFIHSCQSILNALLLFLLTNLSEKSLACLHIKWLCLNFLLIIVMFFIWITLRRLYLAFLTSEIFHILLLLNQRLILDYLICLILLHNFILIIIPKFYNI